MLLQDVHILTNIRILNEGAGNTRMKISGCFQRADEANNNKRIYPKKVLESSVKALQTPISERMLVGELDHPEYDVVKLSNASHLITGLRMQGGEMIGEAEILSTPAGQAVRNLISDGVKVGISSRGMGSLQDNPDGTRTVNEDYKCLTFDIVADPSTRGAFPGLTESTKIRDIVETTINEASREKIFVQLLKDRLEETKAPKGLQEGLFDAMGIGDDPKVPETPASLRKPKPAAEEPPAESRDSALNRMARNRIQRRSDAREEKRRRQRSSTNYKELFGPATKNIIEGKGPAKPSQTEATVKLVIKNLTTKYKEPTDAPKGYEKKAGRPKFKLGSQI